MRTSIDPRTKVFRNSREVSIEINIFRWGAINKVNNGKGTLFWKDTWLGDVPLSIKYHKFFEKCGEKDALVADYFVEDDWEVDLLRPLMSGDLYSWGEFMGDL